MTEQARIGSGRVGDTGTLLGQITIRPFCPNSPNFDRAFLNFFGHYHSFVDIIFGEVSG